MISYAKTTKMNPSWLFIGSMIMMLMMTSSVVYGQSSTSESNETKLTSDCNICGEGNLIGSTTSVVEFVYKGETVKNNCLRWSQIVVNPNAISEQFCKEEMLNYTIDKCRCTTPDGNLLSDIIKESMSSVSSSSSGSGGSTPSSPMIRSPSSPASSPTVKSMSKPSSTSSSSSSSWGNNNISVIMMTTMTTIIFVVSR